MLLPEARTQSAFGGGSTLLSPDANRGALILASIYLGSSSRTHGFSKLPGGGLEKDDKACVLLEDWSIIAVFVAGWHGSFLAFLDAKSCSRDHKATTLFKNLQPIGVGAGCDVEAPGWLRGARVLRGCLGHAGAGAWMLLILLRGASLAVGSGADSNRYTLVLTHMI